MKRNRIIHSKLIFNRCPLHVTNRLLPLIHFSLGITQKQFLLILIPTRKLLLLKTPIFPRLPNPSFYSLKKTKLFKNILRLESSYLLTFISIQHSLFYFLNVFIYYWINDILVKKKALFIISVVWVVWIFGLNIFLFC